jgi:hypothetical protein
MLGQHKKRLTARPLDLADVVSAHHVCHDVHVGGRPDDDPCAISHGQVGPVRRPADQIVRGRQQGAQQHRVESVHREKRKENQAKENLKRKQKHNIVFLLNQLVGEQ